MKQQQQRTETIQEQRVSPAAALSMQQEEPPFSFTKAQIIAMGGTLAASGLLDMALHFNPEWVAAGILATAIAGKATPLFQTVIGMFVPTDPDAVEDVASRIVDVVAPMEETDLPQDTVSKLKRLFHIGQDQYIEEQAQPKEEREPLSKRAQKNVASPNQGKERWIPSQFLLDDVLDVVQSTRDVYFGNSELGAIILSLKKMYHVFDVSASGQGKSNRFRLAMMQLVNHCETYFINPLANSIKAVEDDRKIEVWKPIFDRLANGKPVKEAAEIRAIMNALLKQIQTRKEQERNDDFSWLDRPIFVFVDELPEIFALCPEAVETLDRIVRTGRQFCVFCWVASQSASVEDIGQSTATQAQYKTRIYGGGDRNSSGRMMKGSVPMTDEQALQTNGAGLTLMLADGIPSATFVRAPLVTNEALFEYFGLPPFQLSEWLPAQKKSPSGKQNLLADLSPDLLPSTFSPEEKEVTQAQNAIFDEGKRVKGKRVKGPNYDAILEAVKQLEAEEKVLTLNAIARRAGLTRHQYDEIEETVTYYGYDLVAGKGRPAERG